MSFSGPSIPDGDRIPIRVLVLEDCPEDASLCLRELERDGFETLADVVSTLEGMEACVRSKAYDIILSDYKLPQGTGMEALAILQKEANGIPLILVTGALGEEEAVECVRQGVTDFVLKHHLSRLVPVVRRALAEQQMRVAQERGRKAVANLAAIVESSPDAIVGCRLDGTVTSWNLGAERMYGYTAEEALGGPMSLIIPPDRRHERPVLLGKPEHRESVRYGETVRLHKDGGRIPVLVAVAQVKIATGEILGVSEIAHDISDLKRLEEQLRGRNQELEEQNRRVQEANRVKSEFLANMSHELRTPLNSIIGFAELLHDGKVGAVSDPQRSTSATSSSSQHLLHLINDVLDLAKVESGKMEFRPEPVDLERLVQEVRPHPPGGGFEKAHPDPDGRGPRHGPGGGGPGQAQTDPLQLSLERSEVHAPRRAGSDAGQAERPDQFRLEVEDTGIGIPPEDIGRLFVEFQQLEPGAAKRYGGAAWGWP